MNKSGKGDGKKYDGLVVKTNHETAFDSRWSELKIDGKNIPSRSNHVAAFFDHKLFIHGGYDADKGALSDFYCLDVADDVEFFEWKKLNNTLNGTPIRLKSHSAVNYKTWIVLFGGEVNGNCGTNTLLCYDIIENNWRELKTTDKLQIPKVDSHAVTLMDNKMFMFGGYISEKAEYNKNLYCLDLQKMVWELYWESKGGKDEPMGRSNFDLVNDGTHLWIFGGINDHDNMQDFWKFDLTLKKWEKDESKNAPEGRRGHSMIEFKNNIFLFGGIQDVTKEKNDIYVFQKATKTWNKIHTSTNSVYECSPTLKRDRKKSQNKSPDKITLKKISPDKSNKDSDVMKKILNENKQKKFLEKKKELLKQFSEKPNQMGKQRSYSPTTESMVKTLESIGNQETTKNELKQEIMYDQSHRFIIGKKPCARDGQTVNIWQQKMYIFGGDRHLMAFNDLYSFDLEKGLKSIQLYKSDE